MNPPSPLPDDRGDPPRPDDEPAGTPLRERPDAPLGTLIFRAGLLPAETIESALEEGIRTGRRLGEVLTECGLIDEADVARLLAGQKGLEFVTLRDEGVDPAVAALFTEEQARLFHALPFAVEDGLPVVAIADPNDEILARNIREALGRRDVSYVVCTRSELAEVIAEAYSGAPAALAPSGARKPKSRHSARKKRASAPPPKPPLAPAPTPAVYRVGVCLTTGERVEAGAFADLESAKQHAKGLMLQIAGAGEGDWPFVDGRFLKPDTIVSVDIAEPSAA